MSFESFDIDSLESIVSEDYEHGFVNDTDSKTITQGINEEVITLISKKKKEPAWLLESRLKAYRHWLTTNDPSWSHLKIDPTEN